MTPLDNCEGFDRYSGERWIYPNNMAIRGYQKQAVEKALFTNAMIVLPTGFGKTFIAAVVMYNFYRWYPEGKIIFVAPTRPLVAQQIHECKKISGIPSSDCIELTGSTPKEKRSIYWEIKRVFFATPQVIENDLENSNLPARQVKCIVIDEAHRAQGGYSYVGIVKQLHERNKNGFRILALSATPGSDIQRVQQVMLNLYIGDVMFRSENSIDLMQFKNEKITKAWTVQLTGKHKEFVDKFIRISDPTFKALYRAGLTYSGDSIERVSRYTILQGQTKINRDEGGRNKGRLNVLCAAAISMSYNFELLTLYGIRVFYTSIMRSLAETRSSLKTILASSVEFDYMLKDIRQLFGDEVEPDITKEAKTDLLQGHPKLRVVKDLLMKHFEQNAQKTETRAIVFTKYRESVYDIVQALKAFDPILKPGAFVGQGSASKTGVGMKQKDQILMVNDFKAGKYNVMVATCVAEEGLDIGEVDLIICYDTTSSPISNTQRRGRTGRKRSGDVQTLLTKDYEERKLKKASYSKRQVEEQLFKRENFMTHRYRDAPRMVPKDINPICLEQKIFPVDDEEKVESKKKRQKKTIISPKVEKNKDKEKEKEIKMDIEIEKLNKKDVEFVQEKEIETDTDLEAESGVELVVEKSMEQQKVAESDSEIEWGSDIEWNCV